MSKLLAIKVLDGSYKCYGIIEIFDTCEGPRTRVVGGRYATEAEANKRIEELLTPKQEEPFYTPESPYP